jgi:hypothetical protein
MRVSDALRFHALGVDNYIQNYVTTSCGPEAAIPYNDLRPGQARHAEKADQSMVKTGAREFLFQSYVIWMESLLGPAQYVSLQNVITTHVNKVNRSHHPDR